MSPPLEAIVEKIRLHPKLVIAEDFEIAVQQTHSTARQFRNGDETATREDEGLWISLRILHRRHPGRAVVTSDDRASIQQLVESAFESSRRASPDPWFRFPLWKRPRVDDPPEPPPEFSGATESSTLFPEIQAAPEVFDEMYELKSVRTYLFRKSERFQLSHTRRVHGAKLSVIDSAPERLVRLREERAHSHPLSARREWLDSLLHQLSELKRGEAVTPAACPKLLAGPAVTAALLKKLVPSFFADAVQGGRSPWAALKEQGPLSSEITLVDDGRYPGGMLSAPFDLEGALTQETCLVERGQMKELLYDTYAATRENRISTGNFLRGPAQLDPGVGASHFYLRPRTSSLGDLLSSMGRGLFLQSIENVEPVPGSQTEISFLASGWEVDSEECARPLAPVAMRVDLGELFRRAVQVADDLTFFAGGGGAYGAPSVLFDLIGLDILEGA